MGSPDRISQHSARRVLRAQKEKAERRQRIRQQEEREGYQAAISGQATGTVATILPGSITIYHDDEYFVVPSGKHHRLAVGDWVSFPLSSPRNFTGPLPRQSVIARLHGDWSRRGNNKLTKQVIAANVDLALIVASTQDPPFHPRFVDRYLVIAQMGGVTPVLILNKADLTTERHPHLEAYRAIGLPFIETSAITKQGFDLIRNLIQGKTAVMVGNSGVGKSTLINALVPELQLRTHEISAHTGKGQHTTTTSHLYKWAEDSFIIDTPGIRSLGMQSIPRQDLTGYFPEFSDYTSSCRYSDCTHAHEPSCSVIAAVESGKINRLRYESYLRLLNE